jgi:chromosome segregation protein
VSGGGPGNSRGILGTKRAIKELRQRVVAEREEASRLVETVSAREAMMVQAADAIVALNAERHAHEKALVGFDAQLQRAGDDHLRLVQKGAQLARERHQAEEERDALGGRQAEAEAAIVRLEAEQRAADERLTIAQRKVFEARESLQDLGRRTADAGASHAALVERASALESEVLRLQETLAEFDERAMALSGELDAVRRGRDERLSAIATGEAERETGVRALEALLVDVRAADEAVVDLRAAVERLEGDGRTARTALDEARAAEAELDVALATAESDLSHLTDACVIAVQLTPEQALAEVMAQEEAGTTPAALGAGEDEDGDEVSEPGGDASVLEDDAAAASVAVEALPGAARALDAEEAVKRLRARIERLGPVNMMAIEQYDELESRHAFLTAQRKDLVESIAQTGQAITRIDETTRRRFAEAFVAINRNFQATFSTLFGGGRAGLTLVDDTNPLESGIEIVAQPPGKRLQNVQLLSGGEKALTAIALMFGLFQYKPSPFCLLDEIDAPLDDANIGRFVEMLRGMQQQTQFILITHNRKTMEIADRLYGVTMEEPGVSKLISVQLN